VICGDSTDSAVLGQLWQGVDRRFQMIGPTRPGQSVMAKKPDGWSVVVRKGDERRFKNDSLKPNEIRKLFGSPCERHRARRVGSLDLRGGALGQPAALLYRRARGRWVFLHGYLDLGQERDGARPGRLSPSTTKLFCTAGAKTRLTTSAPIGSRTPFSNRSTAGQSVIPLPSLSNWWRE